MATQDKKKTNTGTKKSSVNNTTNKKVNTSTKPIAKAKSTTAKRPSKKQNVKKNEVTIASEIIFLIMLAISILLFIAIYFGNSAGIVGKFFNNITFKFMGAIAYIFPLYLVVATIYKVTNRNKKTVSIKLLCSILFLMVIATFLHSIVLEYIPNTSFKSIFHDAIDLSKPKTLSGGVIGGFFTAIFFNLLGKAGTIVILVLVTIVLLIFMLEKSFVNLIRKCTLKTTKLVKESHEGAEEILAQTSFEVENSSDRRTNKTYASQDNSVLLERVTLKDKKATKNKKEDNVPVVKEIDFTIDGIPNVDVNDKIKAIPEIKPVRQAEFGEIEMPIEELARKNKSTKDKEVNNTKTTADVPKDENKEIVNNEQGSVPFEYVFPPIELLGENEADSSISKQEFRENALKLQKTLENFGVKVTVTHVSCGPSVTRYELQPEQGTKVSKIVALSDDLKLNLEASDIRIEAPIPGKAAVGIEVPNKNKQAVLLREIIESDEFKKFPSDLAFAVGKDVAGRLIVTDLAKMPHLLIAGSTGSGKSVCINTLIASVLYKSDPADVKLIMIDPKVVELSVYNGIPHLLIPVVTDPKKASAALNWAVMEMTDRYQKFAEVSVRDLRGYNEKIADMEDREKLPQIVVIVDELADLMMVAPGEVEDCICRLAQMARAAGIHLVIATQRPSVNVITGLIKANVPSRIAFAVSSGVDSRTIIDMNGAEKLLGKGDMLFYPVGMQKPIRVQGALITDKEVTSVVEFLGRNQINQYNQNVMNKLSSGASAKSLASSERDEYFEESARIIIEKDKASIGMLQRLLKIGFNRAARIMDQLEEAGVVGPEEGTKPRNILMTIDQFDDYMNL